jgi:cytochrome c biogenesis protein CcmG/thiol:disulfide interchange protein DsbE
MSRRLRLLATVLLATAAIAALIVFGFASKRSPLLGRPAPPLPTERLAGPPVTVASLHASAGGRPAAIVFWASWCEPCQVEAAAIERFSHAPQGAGRVVGVDWNDALSGARAFIAHNHWTFPNVRDAEGTIGSEYRITGLPTTFVLDGRGRIRKTLRGPQDGASLARALAAVEDSPPV